MDTEITVGLFTLAGTLFGYLANYGVERLRAKNDKKNYISQIRFDKEFEIYQELSERNLTMVYDAGEALVLARITKSRKKCTLISIEENPEQSLLNMINKHKEEFITHLNDTGFINKKYAPFINSDIFNAYNQLYKISTVIYNLFIYIVVYDDNSRYVVTDENKQKITCDKEQALSIIEEKQKILSALSDEILDKLRNYLKSLDVKE